MMCRNRVGDSFAGRRHLTAVMGYGGGKALNSSMLTTDNNRSSTKYNEVHIIG